LLRRGVPARGTASITKRGYEGGILSLQHEEILKKKKKRHVLLPKKNEGRGESFLSQKATTWKKIVRLWGGRSEKKKKTVQGKPEEGFTFVRNKVQKEKGELVSSLLEKEDVLE